MPSVVKVLLILACIGGVASVGMMVFAAMAGRVRPAGEAAEEEPKAESVPEPVKKEEPVFTPLGEDEPVTAVRTKKQKKKDKQSHKAEEEEKTVSAPAENIVELPTVKAEEPKAEPALLPVQPAKKEEKQQEEAKPVIPVQEEKREEKKEEPAPAAAEPETLPVPNNPVLEDDALLQFADYEHKLVESVSAAVGDIKLSVGNAQHIGTREQQQDAFAITPLEDADVVVNHGVMAVVCDGMGGMENGAEAANMGAVQFMRSYLEQDESGKDALLHAVTQTNKMIYDAFGSGEIPSGTTLAAAAVLPSGLRFVSVGDSHIYLYRRGRIYQINRDHNYFAELMEQVKAGKMSLEEAQKHPERTHLTSYVGLKKLELVDYNTDAVAVHPGDRVLICTDGLFKTLSLEEIASTIMNSKNYEAQDDLMQAVLAKGKHRQDNVTIVMLYCDKV